jgi:hypothetical protein
MRRKMMLEFSFSHRCSGSFNLRGLDFSPKSSRIPPAFPDSGHNPRDIHPFLINPLIHPIW